MAPTESRSGTPVAPEIAADELRRRAQASGARRPSLSQGGAERVALVEWASQQGILREPSFLAEIRVVGSASEHTVFHEEGTRTALKATHPDRYGHSMRRPGTMATPAEYFDRWAAHNAIFGDDAVVEAVIVDEGHLQIVMRQTWIEAHPHDPTPTQAEIDAYMADHGFERLAISGPPLYFHAALDLLAGDAHDQNLIRNPDGELHAIDVTIGTPSAELRAELGLPPL